MRYAACILLLFTVLVGCSKKTNTRTNFAQVTVAGKQFLFDSVEAVLDTSAQAMQFNVSVRDHASNSTIVWETLSGSNWINGVYQYPGEQFPGRSLVYMHMQTYVNAVPGSYSIDNHSLTILIDQSDNGRIHGTFSGKMTCYTCTPYGAEVDITNGEFEMPFSYR